MKGLAPGSIAVIVVLATLATALYGFFELPWDLVPEDSLRDPQNAAEGEDRVVKAHNDVRLAALAFMTFLTALGGSLLTWRTVRLTRQGQLTDRYAQAVTGVASQDEASQLGALHSLEGVAHVSRADYWPATSIIVEFVRRSAGPAPESQPADGAVRTVPASLATAIRILGRRRRRWDEDDRLDLAGLDLRNADLRGADLRGTNLSESDLSGALLDAARLDGVPLVNATLRECHLDAASLRGANLTDAVLDGSRVQALDLRGATLLRTSMEGVRGTPRRS